MLTARFDAYSNVLNLIAGGVWRQSRWPALVYVLYSHTEYLRPCDVEAFMRIRPFALGAVAFALSLGLTFPVLASQTITATQARNHVGEIASVCGNVATTHFVATSRGRPTFINLDRPYPDQIFTVVIRGSDRAKFGRPQTEYRGRDICVCGEITESRGTSEIIASNPAQIRTRQKQGK